MKVVDPGHSYLLDSLDGGAPAPLMFVKREGASYPGNVGHHPGTTMQECLRALIERCGYVNRQAPCAETQAARGLLCTALWLLEARAARRHGRHLDVACLDGVEHEPTCPVCGHIGHDCRA